jgi:F-type H+-transporting ATPase subunit b
MAEASNSNAVTTEGEVIAGTTVDGANAIHAKPHALGMDATMWVALAMLVVIGLAIWKKVPAMIGAALDKQIGVIKDQLDAATNLRNEAEALKAEYESMAKSAAVDAAEMKVAAEAEAKEIIAKAKVDATALIARRTAMAEQKIAAAELAAISDVRAAAASVAAGAAAHLIRDRHDAKVDKAIVDQTIAALN